MATRKPLEDWQVEDAERLDALFTKHAHLNQTEFGARYGIGTQGMVWQYLSGRRPLNIKAAEAFSRGLNITIDEFSPSIAKQIRQAAQRVKGMGVAWPFPLVEQEAIVRLEPPALIQLQDAMLDAADRLGLDIKKD